MFNLNVIGGGSGSIEQAAAAGQVRGGLLPAQLVSRPRPDYRPTHHISCAGDKIADRWTPVTHGLRGARRVFLRPPRRATRAGTHKVLSIHVKEQPATTLSCSKFSYFYYVPNPSKSSRNALFNLQSYCETAWL